MTTRLGWTQASTPFDFAARYEPSILSASSSSTIAYICVSILFAYYLLTYLDALPFTISQAIWHSLVFLVPSRVVFALDRDKNAGSGTEKTTTSATHQAKSEAMRRILGIESESFLSTFPRAKSLSGIGSVFLGARDQIPAGLGNWDNSCYQNSVIQGLASLRSLDAFLDANIKELGETASLPTHLALKSIMSRLNDPSYSGQKLWTPPGLKSMSSWQQQDAQEYFSKVIDQMDKEILHGIKGRTSNAGLKIVDRYEDVTMISSSTSSSTDDNATSESDESSEFPIRNPLEGLLAQRVGCMRCGWTEGLSLIPFNCLTVQLGKSWEIDIQDCLDEYTTLEPIEGVECSKCTLLRTRAQLLQLLKQIEDDAAQQENGPVEPSSSQVSSVLKASAQSRLQAVEEALDNEDFADKTLSTKCHIPAKNRVSSTKSRQAVIARPPTSLVIHVNRSIFDEMTGALRKNYADVRFPKVMDLDEWCLGTNPTGDDTETWDTDPSESMLPRPDSNIETPQREYELRAVVTHYGRHENGHYICYRKYSAETFPAPVPEAVLETDEETGETERWFRLSDEDVAMVSERNVMSQGGVFMLFYEAVAQEERLESTEDSMLGSHDTVPSTITGEDATDASPDGNETPPTDDNTDSQYTSMSYQGSETSDCPSSRSSAQPVESSQLKELGSPVQYTTCAKEQAEVKSKIPDISLTTATSTTT